MASRSDGWRRSPSASGWYFAAIGLVLLVLLALVPLVWTLPTEMRNVTIALPASFSFADQGTLVASPSIDSAVVPLRIQNARGMLMVRPLNGAAVTVAAILPIVNFALLL